MGARRSARFSVLPRLGPRRLPPGSRRLALASISRAPERADSRSWAHDGVLDFRALQTVSLQVLGPGWISRAPERSDSWRLSLFESWAHEGVLEFQCSQKVSLQGLGSGWNAESQERADSRLLKHGRTTECSIFYLQGLSSGWITVPQAGSRRVHHGRTTECSICSASQASPSGVSALAGFPSPREGQQ